MGDRASISFKNKGYESVSLFNHWGGMEFVERAVGYVRNLQDAIKQGVVRKSMPLGRLEPETMLVDFIREYTKGDKRVESSLYLGKDHNDGDNSDNGHFTIDVNEPMI